MEIEFPAFHFKYREIESLIIDWKLKIMFIFRLQVEKEQFCLTLFKDGNEVALRKWEDKRDMGRQLFSAIDAMLKEEGLEPTDIKDFQVKTSISDTFTSVKIAQIVAETYRFAVNVS